MPSKLAHELVEQMHGLVAIRLQRFDDRLAREHLLDLIAQLVDFLDLLVELGDLRLQQVIARVLVVDARSEECVTAGDDGNTEHRQCNDKRDELALTGQPLLLAMGQ